MEWWAKNNLRLIQNNLRETDASMDVDLLISELQSFNANVLMMNAGGIFAFYPSELDHQYVTPYLTKDLLGEAVEKAHEAGMKFIARFDFSKAHESLFRSHPEWFYRNRHGQEVNYHGIVHTCLNGEYQQQKSLLSVAEVLEKYEVDGIFFNMFGYQHWDYSGNYYGPCYCDQCRQRFLQVTGHDLSEYTGQGHELHTKYSQFQEITSREILHRIHTFVKSRWKHVAISTYHHHQVDIVRNESNTSLSRKGPRWVYSASENVASIQNSWKDKLVSNCSINAIDLPYRFTGVSPEETSIRLYQNIANGSGLDFCIIGAFEGYPDPSSFEVVKSIYQFHAMHEDVFGKMESVAQIVLVKPNHRAAIEEYYGLYKILKEAHIVFDVIMEEQIEAMRTKLRSARAVIMPGIQNPSEGFIQTIRSIQQAETPLIATGIALEDNPDLLTEWFGVTMESRSNEMAAYFDVSNEQHFPSLTNRKWIIAAGSFARVQFDSTAERRMNYIESSTFGPPERAYGHRAGEAYGMGIVRKHMKEAECIQSVYYPWNPGSLYYKHGYEDHKFALLDLLHEIIQVPLISTNAPACTELFLHRLENGSYLLQLINLSGFNGTTYMEPIPIMNLRIELQLGQLQSRVYSSKSSFSDAMIHAKTIHTGQTVHVDRCSDSIFITIPELKRYEAIILRAADRNDSRGGANHETTAERPFG
ncbi:family 10 glycosylhydrolase [Paenibacillus urinalis]|uniref:family 10 glycosylhydrolase n=1 Tax=Paenibacillus urinalis TaxID=521520 RepID=UPI0036340F6B